MLTRSAFGAHTAKRVRAELVVDPVVAAFTEQVQVEVRQLRREVVRVVLGEFVAVPVADAQLVRLQWPAVRHAPLEQARRVDALERRGGGAVLPAHLDLLGIGLERAHQAERLLVLARELVIAEQRTRLRMPRTDQRVDVACGELVLGGHGAQITGLMRQMRCAYSRMLRSLEKMPMLSVLMTALRSHSSGRRYSASTASCAAA
jgi:hypothetical protein